VSRKTFCAKATATDMCDWQMVSLDERLEYANPGEPADRAAQQ
jgi:hypothetical protein